MKIRYFQDTNNFMLTLGSQLSELKPRSVSTKSTAVTLMYYPEKYAYVLDFIVGTYYIEKSYKSRSIRLQLVNEYLGIYFVAQTEVSLEDLFESKDSFDSSNVRVFLLNWNVSYILIHKNFINAKELNNLNLEYEG